MSESDERAVLDGALNNKKKNKTTPKKQTNKNTGASNTVSTPFRNEKTS